MTRDKPAKKRMQRGTLASPVLSPAKPVAADSPPARANPTRKAGLSLPSPVAGTNLVIADIVLRAAGGLLRKRMEKGLIIASYDKARAEKLVDGQSVVTTAALWGASRMASRSPVGLAVVAGGLVAKVLYDRGKRFEVTRRARKRSSPDD